MTVIQQHTFAAYLQVDGVSLPGSFDKCEGGNVTSSTESYRPGGMVPSIPLSSPSETEDVTVTRYFEAGRDMADMERLKNRAGLAKASVTKVYLDSDKTPIGREVFAGILKEVQTPEMDSTADSGVAEVGYVITVAS